MFACGGGNLCYNDGMNKIVNVLKKYMYVVAIFIVMSIILSITYSNFIVTSNNHKAAEMYIGALKYSIEIDGDGVNNLSVPSGETIVDVKVNNLNPVDTYYKLFYLKNSNLTVEYFETTKDTDDVVTTYSKPNDSITNSNSNTIKLKITNSSTSSQNISLSVKGGYITNTISDITTPSTYSEIVLTETSSSNTYFCRIDDILTQGLKYKNEQYTYSYKQDYNIDFGWQNMDDYGWGVKLTNINDMIEVSSKLCTYINNKPIISTSYLFAYTKAKALDLSNFNTINIKNMSHMFENNQTTTLDLSSFNTSNVIDMSYMFYNASQLNTIYVSDKFKIINVNNSINMFRTCTNLIGGAGTKYNSSYIDKTYAHIDGATSNPGYFTDIADKDIPAPNSFATDSWKTIIKAVRTNNISKYNVGDTKTIDLGTTYGTHTLRIANTSTPSECSSEDFSQTACGFVLEFADIITTHNMNPKGEYNGTTYNSGWNVDGWPATSMRTFVNNDIYNSLPSDLKNIIIDTTVVSEHGKSDTLNFTSIDKLYLLASKEIYTDFDEYYGYETSKYLTRTLDYYKNLEVTTSSYSGAAKEAAWWTRTPDVYGDTDFWFLFSTGSGSSTNASSSMGVSPAFRIG